MAKTLKDCINSLVNQTVTDFRLIIIDDASSDETEDVIRSFSDKRIHYKRNERRRGIAASRNIGIKELNDEGIVLFIDADCYAEPSWVAACLKAFSDEPLAIAVEGITTYGGAGYHPGLSEKSYHFDFKAGMCHTDNCAYRIEVFQKIGGFDEENFNHLLEDTDFFYRARKAFRDRKFLVCPEMKVIHRKSFWGISGFFRDTHKVRYFIRIIKKHGRLDYGAGRFGSYILSPKNFILAAFPPAIFLYLVWGRRRIVNLYDLFFVPLYIVKAYYYRILVWYYALKEKVLII